MLSRLVRVALSLTTSLFLFAMLVQAEPDGSDPNSLIKQAREALKKQRFDDAVALFSKALASDPANVDALARRAQAYAGAGKPADALKDLDAAIKLDPANRSNLLERARLRDAQGLVAEAIDDCTRALAWKKDASAFQMRAAMYEKTGQLENAVADYSEVLRYQPFRPDLYLARGKLYKALGQMQKAGTDFGQAVRLNPTYRITVSRAAGQESEHPAVVKPTLASVVPQENQAAPEIARQPESKLVVVEKAKNAEPATTTAEAASGQQRVPQRPESAQARPAESKPLEMRSVETAPPSSTQQAAANVGSPSAESNAGTPAPAHTSPAAATAAAITTPAQTTPQPAPAAVPPTPAPSTDDTHQYNSIVQAARNQFTSKQYAEAAATFSKVIDMRPKLPDGYIRRCAAFYMAGDAAAALRDCTHAIEIGTRDSDAYYYRGRALLDQKDYLKAIENLTFAVEFKPYFPEAHYYRAQANRALDNLSQALYGYSEAARQKQGYVEAIQARADIRLLLGDKTGHEHDLELLKSASTRK